MEIRQAVLHNWPADRPLLAPLGQIAPGLLLVFGSPALLSWPGLADALAQEFPEAIRVGCSTAGEIANGSLAEGSVVVTALAFAATPLRQASTVLASMDDSRACGERLGQQLAAAGLRAVLVFGQGVGINGSALIDGLAAALPQGVSISGGLAGDDAAFERTWVLDRQGLSAERVAAVGLYGERVRIGNGCFGGWQAFGPMRKVTRSAGNILYALDDEPALDVYKRYLGDYARTLPSSGLLFPFEMFSSAQESAGLFRTILGIDEAEGSLILAGDIDPHGYLRLMHAQTDRLVDGAELAAEATLKSLAAVPAGGLGLLVSCVGRKLVMGGRAEEEVEAVKHVLGPKLVLAGFYSYGEISPISAGVECKLHNQTMTITFIGED